MYHVTMITSLSGVVCHFRLGLGMVKLCTKFEVSNSSGYEYRKDDEKSRE